MHFLRVLALAASALAAPIVQPREDADVIPGQFIVVLKNGASDNLLQSSIDEATSLLGGTAPQLVHNLGSFKGFTVAGADNVIDAISNLSHVEYIEPDTKISINTIVTESNAPWGLGRISHREPGSTDYVYDDSAGEGTYAYIIDTGIYIAHDEFDGRATWGANFAEDGLDSDGNGHGTHVAGTTGGKTYGVAKKTNLIAVKVLDSDGSGSNSQVIAGIEWAVTDATSKGRIGKAVANMSLGGFRLGEATNQAAAAAVEAGLFLAVAAGNDGLPAILFTPASEPSVCTVGASDIDDSRASFSNWGALVDIFAPGVDVLSAWNNGTSETNIISGTSMATPHITGLGAYLLALEGKMDPIALCERIQNLSTTDALSNPGLLTGNRLAFNGATS